MDFEVKAANVAVMHAGNANVWVILNCLWRWTGSAAVTVEAAAMKAATIKPVA
ncbi:hypothetical protein IFR09_05805 [Pseudomonas syringae]|nr:hypothetical protein [Pseudomonas syringae]MBD8574683.1 hypothetical protein [Pseudomonas syringae]MBD8789245.1 hypothetical protein [Pseudomonas syringae]MBD8800311.1 hypothetical protein [Pseudomonas syringae]MBD8810673.1 hypothetical protein [Pseudomonas syringae]